MNNFQTFLQKAYSGLPSDPLTIEVSEYNISPLNVGIDLVNLRPHIRSAIG